MPTQVADGEGRESTLFRFIGSMCGKGLPDAEVRQGAHDCNAQRIVPPLDFAKVEDQVNRQLARRAERLGLPAKAIAPIANAVAPGLDLSKYRVMMDAAAPPPAPRTFAIGAGREGLWPLGKVSVLGAFGGFFKSALMILLGMHVASGATWAGLPVALGCVLFVSLEDDADELRRRFGATAKGLFATNLHASLNQNFGAIALPGVPVALTKVTAFGHLERTALIDEIIAEAKRHAGACGVPIRMIVIDHARLVMGGDLNASEAATAGMSACTAIAEATGAAVVLLCHSPKAAGSKKRDTEFGHADILGSGAFVDNARCAAVITALTPKEVKAFQLDEAMAKQYLALRVVKSNYSEAGRVIYMQKTPSPCGNAAYPVALTMAPAQPAPKSAAPAIAQRVLDFIKAHPGEFTPNKLRGLAAKDGVLQASDREVLVALGDLKADGSIVEREPTEAEIAANGGRKRDKVLDFGAQKGTP